MEKAVIEALVRNLVEGRFVPSLLVRIEPFILEAVAARKYVEDYREAFGFTPGGVKVSYLDIKPLIAQLQRDLVSVLTPKINA